MKRLLLPVIIVVFVGLAGCQPETDSSTEPAVQPNASPTNSAEDESQTHADPTTRPEDPALSASDSTEVALNPKNTKIQFVGLHVGDDPNPRTGVFEKFEGTAIIASGELSSVNVTVETESLKTDIGNLTNHLKSADFLDAREHPQAQFTSTSIATGDDGTQTIKGDLTLHGVTKPISFPATVSVDGNQLTLHSEFILDRTEFGMSEKLDGVQKEIAMTISVGE